MHIFFYKKQEHNIKKGKTKNMKTEKYIESKKSLAKSYFQMGFNCAQSVVLAFADEVKIDKDSLLSLSSPFGGGMGQLREVCGAVSGMFIIEGMLFGYSSPTDKEEKQRVYLETKSLGEKFKEKNKSIICRELLEGIDHNTNGTPAQRTSEYYHKRPCAELVEIAAGILAEHIKEFDNYY